MVSGLRPTVKVGDIFPIVKYGDVVVLEYVDCKNIKVKFISTGFETSVCSTRLRRGDLVDFIAKGTKYYGKGTYDFWQFEDLYRKEKNFIKIYTLWSNMLIRCYDELCHQKRPTYKFCTVSDEWLLFSNFHEWVIKQQWEGNHLDKDLLVVGNKLYSKDTCVFIHPLVNTFMSRCGDHSSTGTYLRKSSGKYLANVSNPFLKNTEFLGSFLTKDEANTAWRERKRELSILLAESEYVWDDVVKNALKNRYLD